MAVSRQDAKAYLMHSFFSACKAISTGVKEHFFKCQIKSRGPPTKAQTACSADPAVPAAISAWWCVFVAETVRSRNVTEVPSHVPINMLGLPSLTL